MYNHQYPYIIPATYCLIKSFMQNQNYQAIHGDENSGDVEEGTGIYSSEIEDLNTEPKNNISEKTILYKKSKKTIPSTPQLSLIEVIKKTSMLFLSRQNYYSIIIVFILTMSAMTLNFFNPYLFGSIINDLTKNKNDNEKQKIYISIIILLVTYALAQLIQNINEKMSNYIGEEIKQKVLRQISLHLTQQKIEYCKTEKKETLTSLIRNGFQVSNAFMPTLTRIPSTVLEIIIAICLLIYWYGALVGLILPVTIAIQIKYILSEADNAYAYNNKADKFHGQIFSKMNSFINEYEIMHDYGRTQDLLESTNELIDELILMEIESQHIPLKIGLFQILISRFSMGITILYIATKILSQENENSKYTYQDFVVLTTYLNALCNFLPILGDAVMRSYSFYPSLENVIAKISGESRISDGYKALEIELSKGDTCIEFKNISFFYPNKKQIFRNISFKIKVGETIAIVGANGVGKSSLFDLISRYYEPNEGQICIYGQDIKDIKAASLRDNICRVRQKPQLLNETIRFNLKYGLKKSEDFFDQQLCEHIKKLHMQDFINSCSSTESTKNDNIALINGLNYEVGVNGEKLSGGGRQKISILRGMIKDAPIRLFDEITSSLDTESSVNILECIRTNKLPQETHLIISHKLNEIINADKIIVFSEGAIVGQGTHDELLSDCEVYQRLWESQNLEITQSSLQQESSISHLGLFPSGENSTSHLSLENRML